MKKETFIGALQRIKDHYIHLDVKYNNLCNLFGPGNTYIVIEEQFADGMVDVVLNDMGADDFMFYLVTDIFDDSADEHFGYNNKKYRSTFEGVWEALNDAKGKEHD
jgi:hypothetical protein